MSAWNYRSLRYFEDIHSLSSIKHNVITVKSSAISMVLLASLDSVDDSVELEIESDLHNNIHQWLSNNTRVFNTVSSVSHTDLPTRSLCGGNSGVICFHRSLLLQEITSSMMEYEYA
jgi:hypothetical protein